MTKDIKNQEWFYTIVEDLKAIKTEMTWIERQTRIQQYWMIGNQVKESTPLFEKQGIFGREMYRLIARNMQISSRLMYDVMKLVETFDTFEQIENLPEGKNLTWSKLIKNHLRETSNPNKARKKKEPEKHVCPKCHTEFYEIDEKEHVCDRPSRN